MIDAKHFSPLHLALTLALPLMLAACGGEETSTAVYNSAPAPAPTTHLTRSGTIFPNSVGADALVCLDLTGTGVCDAGAATATRPRGDGSYVIRYEPKDSADAENFKTAALLAEISGEQGSYTLSSPGKQSNNINPLTTLVHRQMLQARTLETAEQEVARQLDIDVDAIYEPRTSSVALAAARLTNYSLKNGIAIMIGSTPEAQDNSPRLVSFQFKDGYNYEFDVHVPEGSANDAGQTLWRPVYGGKINGNDRTPENAAYTARFIGSFTFTGREEYLNNGVLKLFPAHNQFTSILLNRKATAESAQKSLDIKAVGYAVETTVQKIDISGLSMQTFFANPESYRSTLKNVVHLESFKMEDASPLADAIFPEGSVLHVQLSTPVGNVSPKHGTQFNVQARVDFVMNALTPITLEQKANDLNPPLEEHPTRALTVKYELNKLAWDAIKTVLNLS